MSAEENKKSPRRRRWWAWLTCAAVVVCLTAAVLVHVFTRDTPLNRLKQQIRSEVPVGSKRARVEVWAHDKLGGRIPNVTEYPLADGFARPTIAEAAGVPVEQRATVLDVVVPCGWCTINGRVAPNHLWVYFLLNETGEVADYRFLTLEELAGVEKRRDGR